MCSFKISKIILDTTCAFWYKLQLHLRVRNILLQIGAERQGDQRFEDRQKGPAQGIITKSSVCRDARFSNKASSRCLFCLFFDK